MRMLRLLTLAAVTIFAFSGLAETVIPVGEFRWVDLDGGGQVIVRHGPVQRVTLVKGDLENTSVRIGAGQRLLIDHKGKHHRDGYRMQIEVVTPHLTGAAVSNGGTVQVVGAFPAQASIDAAVDNGGTVDIRSIAADSVKASVNQGGRIFTTAQKSLSADVESGGAITYWGDVTHVKEAVRDGGVVQRGE